MATVQDAMGKPAEALRHLDEAEPIFAREQNLRFLAWVHEVRARVLERQGRVGEALASLKAFVQTRHALDQRLREQRALQMRFEFDLARKGAGEPDPQSPAAVAGRKVQAVAGATLLAISGGGPVAAGHGDTGDPTSGAVPARCSASP